MADLIDRISGESESLATPRPKINLHRWIGCQRLYAFGEWTGAELVTEFDLQSSEATQAASIKTNIDNQVGATNKSLYILRLEAVCMCVEDQNDNLYHNTDGTVNKTKVLEDIQI